MKYLELQGWMEKDARQAGVCALESGGEAERDIGKRSRDGEGERWGSDRGPEKGQRKGCIFRDGEACKEDVMVRESPLEICREGSC